MKQAISKETYERIIGWCEGSLTEAEHQEFELEMKQNEGLKVAALELQQLYALGQQAEFHFKPFLSGRVLHQLKEGQSEGAIQSLQFAFQRLALPAFAIMLLLLAFTFIGEQSLSLEAVLGTADLEMEDVYSQYLISL